MARGHEHAILSHPELNLPHHFNTADIFTLRGPIETIVFVCGPLTDHRALRDFLAVHRKARKIAVGVSVLDSQHAMSERFETIIARDGSPSATFDLGATCFRADPQRTPTRPPIFAGMSFRGKQTEYGLGRHGLWRAAEKALRQLAVEKALTPLQVDTKLIPTNRPADIGQAFAAADIVLTTRMHGALIGLSSCRPVVAVDQIPGTGKVTAVLKKIGWPFVFSAETLDPQVLSASYDALVGADGPGMVAAAKLSIEQMTAEALSAAADAIIGAA
ncbi:MAG TPA: polysaccharide pyruvyl transferase family protein [Devosiaceae bacterium]